LMGQLIKRMMGQKVDFTNITIGYQDPNYDDYLVKPLINRTEADALVEYLLDNSDKADLLRDMERKVKGSISKTHIGKIELNYLLDKIYGEVL